MNRTYRLLTVMISIILLGCQSSPIQSEEINIYGSLRKVMHHGELDSKVRLQTLPTDNLYALGAVEGLQGEILILDGEPYISEVAADSVVIHENFDHGASLLVSTSVKEWETHPLAASSLADIESVLKPFADRSQGEVLPFLIHGRTKSLDWHVIDWDPKETDHSPTSHKSSGLSGTLSNEDVEILGFYSEKHQGVFTHMGSSIHMHFVTGDRTLAGHVDDLIISQTVKLFVPKKIDR